MTDRKNFKFLVDGELHKGSIKVFPTETVGELKARGREYAKMIKKSKHKLQIYLDRNDMLDVSNTKKYDKVPISNVWDRITDGYIVLTGPVRKTTTIKTTIKTKKTPVVLGAPKSEPTDNLRRLPKDVLVKIHLDLDDRSLFNACQTSKYVREKVCKNLHFWRERFYILLRSVFGEKSEEELKNISKHFKGRSFEEKARNFWKTMFVQELFGELVGGLSPEDLNYISKEYRKDETWEEFYKNLMYYEILPFPLVTLERKDAQSIRNDPIKHAIYFKDPTVFNMWKDEDVRRFLEISVVDRTDENRIPEDLDYDEFVIDTARTLVSNLYEAMLEESTEVDFSWKITPFRRGVRSNIAKIPDNFYERYP